jgi:hypothetical protein
MTEVVTPEHGSIFTGTPLATSEVIFFSQRPRFPSPLTNITYNIIEKRDFLKFNCHVGQAKREKNNRNAFVVYVLYMGDDSNNLSEHKYCNKNTV